MRRTQTTVKSRLRWIVAAVLVSIASVTWAQHGAHGNHAPSVTVTTPAEPMSPDAMPGMDHSTMSVTPIEAPPVPNMDHSGHTMTQPESVPSDTRDPHAFADGYDFSQFPMRHEGGDIKFGTFRVDRLERVHTRDHMTTTYDAQAAFGDDFNRAVLKVEGAVDNGTLDEASTELLWSHTAAAFWNTELGVRYDSGEGSDRQWLAFGVQGLAPYWFEIDTIAYVGASGRTALSIDAEYELLLTQKLILQPRVEAVVYGKDDAELGLGSGLSDVSAGLRLRFEIRREFAPYIGIQWSGMFGGTKDAALAAGVDAQETQVVAGVKFWL